MGKEVLDSLEPAALAGFAAGLANLSTDEIQKAKRLYIFNAIADLENAKTSARGFLTVMGIMSIIPIFLIVFVPMEIGVQNGPRAEENRR